MTMVKTPAFVKDFQLRLDHPISRLKLFSGAYYIPKNNDLKPLGEDAHFVCKDYQTIGVADGVGGWARKGIDAGEYAQELMSNAVFSITNNHQEGDDVDPKVVLNEAFLNTNAEGSSTACIVTLKNTFTHSYLHAANIGDSGFIVFRDNKIVYKSPTQQDRFNCPYQLGKNGSDSPDSAMELVFTVEKGDIVVVATDGLFDNVFGYEMENVVKLEMEDSEKTKMPELLAWLLATRALHRAEDEGYFSPFEKSAQKAGYQHIGGKYDDITVVVAYVRPDDDDSDADSFDVLY